MSGKQFLIIVIVTFVTVIIWVVADTIHSRSEVKLPEELQQLSEPVNPNFDFSVVDQL